MDQAEKKETFLRFIILQKLILGPLEIALSLGILSLLNNDMEAFALGVAGFFNLDIDNLYVSAAIEKVGMMEDSTILGISIGMFLLGSLVLVEGWGLHLRRRWAEWLTVVATALFIPFEVYEIIVKVTPVKVGALVLNCAIVWYLAKHKELFWSKRQLHAQDVKTPSG
jgi:uncharacterized membrane protein (DUF2068 family)